MLRRMLVRRLFFLNMRGRPLVGGAAFTTQRHPPTEKLNLVTDAALGYFPKETHEKSRAGFWGGRPAAEPRARVAGRALAARPAVPARTPAIAALPARDRHARAEHFRLSRPTTAGIQRPGRKPSGRPGRAYGGRPVRQRIAPALAAGRRRFLRHGVGPDPVARLECARRGADVLLGQRRLPRQSRGGRGLSKRQYRI